MPTIKLQSSDDEIFDVDVQVAKCSVTIRNMLDDCESEEDDNAIVPLTKVNAKILGKVLEWAKYHKDDPQPTKDDESNKKSTAEMKSWDDEFLKVDQDQLFELILAANYLDIKSLLELTCKAVANMIKGKTPAEIRKTFNIKDPAEEK
ncbi:S-phase kinase-associated protein 1-like [Drosophila innubila]|uniref:S-phase kinase-associated protein 1-like n=1 Tax=Drosophila innubila TaxID=198719 RepID=UPI00148DCE91|nr:S-phase kinase-associated protein 1-like [Drosophila innubila]